jgi:hypothetical protein
VPELPFVGAGRQRILADLVDAFAATRDSGEPRLVTLEAPSGSGKTRLVRELYRVLAREHQPVASPFWPLDLERGNARDEAVDSRRKHIRPVLTDVAPEAVPAWFWWGLSVRGDAYTQDVHRLHALKQDRTQVVAFAEALRRSDLPAGDRTRKQIRELLQQERPLEGLGSAVFGDAVSAVGAAAGIPVPGASVGQWVAARVVAKGYRRWRAARDEPEVTAGPWADRMDRFVDQLAARIPELSQHVPMILAIEDLHGADIPLVELLLGVLQAGRGRVLIVGTIWPGYLEDTTRDVARLLHGVDRARVTRFPPEAFPALSLEDRTRLARLRIEQERLHIAGEAATGALPPEVSEATCTALATRYRTTPLALEQVCGLPMVRDLLAMGRLDERTVEELPEDDPAQIYGSMWQGLPEDLRSALKLCALTTPTAQSGVLSSTVWDAELARRAGARSGLLGGGADALVQHAGYGWAARLSERLWACNEPPQFTVALERARKEIVPSQIDAFRAALVAELAAERASEDRDDGPLVESHDVIVVGLAMSGALPWSDTSLAPLDAADRLLARALGRDEVGVLHEARVVGAEALERTPERGAEWVERTIAVAELTGRSGSASAAAALLAEVIGVLDGGPASAVAGRDHPARDEVELRRAFWLGEAGRLQDAVTALRALIARFEARAPHPPQLAEARVALASWLGDMARPTEAIAILLQVRDDLEARGGPAGDVIAVQQQLAFWYGESGATTTAIELLEDLEVRLEALRPHGWLVLQSVRQQHGHWLGIRGDAAAAETLLAALERERIDRLGARHPDTLSTRNQRWSWAARRGAVRVGVEEFRLLARDRLEVLGADAPPAHGTRNNLAVMLIEAGLHDEAATLIDDVARTMSDLYTPAHRSAILARANAATVTGIRGDTAGALAGSRRAHADWLAHHLPGTRDELALRGNVGVWLDAEGETPEALRILAATRDEQHAVLGAMDPDTLITGANLAFILDRDGRGEPARTRAAVTALVAVLGDVAPETMTAQHNLGHLLLVRGEVGAAREVLTEVLDRRTRLLGRDHPDTAATADELASLDDPGA